MSSDATQLRSGHEYLLEKKVLMRALRHEAAPNFPHAKSIREWSMRKGIASRRETLNKRDSRAKRKIKLESLYSRDAAISTL